MEAETEADRLEFLLRHYFGQALDIEGNNMPSDNQVYNAYADGATNNVIGQLHSDVEYGCIGCAAWPDAAWGASPNLSAAVIANNDCSMSATASAPVNCTVPVPQWTTLAVFLHEGGTGGPVAAVPPDSTGLPQATAVYFRRPEPAGVDLPSTGGVIFFDFNAGASLTANYSKIFVSRISYFSMRKDVRLNPFGQPRVTSIRFQYRIRYHNGSSDLRSFCPKNDIVRGTAGCGLMDGAVDIERTFSVFLKNNLFKPRGPAGLTGNTYEERIGGSLLYFKPVLPVGLGF